MFWFLLAHAIFSIFRQINWTVLYRRKHRKGMVEEAAKKRTRRTQKFMRAVTGATLADIMAKRNQKPEVRKAQRWGTLCWVRLFISLLLCLPFSLSTRWSVYTFCLSLVHHSFSLWLSFSLAICSVCLSKDGLYPSAFGHWKPASGTYGFTSLGFATKGRNVSC